MLEADSVLTSSLAGRQTLEALGLVTAERRANSDAQDVEGRAAPAVALTFLSSVRAVPDTSVQCLAATAVAGTRCCTTAKCSSIKAVTMLALCLP